MTRSDLLYDWHALAREDRPPRRGGWNRLHAVFAFFVFSACIVLLRAVQLEVTEGEAYRSHANRAISQVVDVPAARGRILAADGTVLACDQRVTSLAIAYRYLQFPLDEKWLSALARKRLPRAQRRDRAKLVRETEAVGAEISQLHERLAQLCGLEAAEFRRRAAVIDARVSAMKEDVRRRQLGRASQQQATSQSLERKRDELTGVLTDVFTGAFQQASSLPATPITIAEELADHVLVERLSPDAIRQIENHPEHYPGVRLVARLKRTYPQASLAAHAVGYLSRQASSVRDEESPAAAGSDIRPAGEAGIERQYETRLCGAAGKLVRRLNQRGQELSRSVQTAPRSGLDIHLTLDAQLQRAAEMALDRALRQPEGGGHRAPRGGALVVLNVQTGAILASASAPRFDPSWFQDEASAELPSALAAAEAPMLDRAVQMAIPPGSVFKVLTAASLLQSGTVGRSQPFECAGFLEDPSRERCLIYRRYGVGHGPITVEGALAQSCNVYFFHFAGRMGGGPLVEWSERFGFGRPTGVDLPFESAGSVPHVPEDRRTQKLALDEVRSLAIGQGSLTVTPLQVARMMAAIASGGRLVRPHVVADDALATAGAESHAQQLDLRPGTLAAIRRGLEQCVGDPSGTAYDTVRVASVAVAGKTGTAETGSSEGDHAWFAGYAPAGRPQVAFAVALEHGGGGSEAAGPVARQIILAMDRLGYFNGDAKAPHQTASHAPTNTGD